MVATDLSLSIISRIFVQTQLVINGSDNVAFKVNDDQIIRSNSGLKPHQPGNDKNRAGSMAMWVAPIRVYNHLSREIPFVSKSIDSAHPGTVV